MDYKDMVYAVVGAAMDVHKELHGGLQEAVYQEALACEFADRNIPFEKEMLVPIHYKHHVLDKYYRLDFVCHGDIVIETKSVEGYFAAEHRSQLFTYLRLTKKPYGVLINFGGKSLQAERYYYDAVKDECLGFLAGR